jgi:hypothetical protein
MAQVKHLPTSLTAGIELADDPLPSLRSAAYAVSYGRRSQPQTPYALVKRMMGRRKERPFLQLG